MRGPKRHREQARPSSRGVSLPGMLLILAVLGAVFYFAFGRKPHGVQVIDEAGETHTVDQTNARAFARQQACTSGCTATARECRATAEDERARAGCADAQEDCQAKCQEEE
ncbi:MAG: hypothetical protein H6702_21675 [Myxococcales bacterium]|nr:hypothetical protein [Myxococcales bacterium]